jgi:arylsulfatase
MTNCQLTPPEHEKTPIKSDQFPIYTHPKEEYPVGHRMNAWLASMAAELKAHAATFKKYPPKDIGLGQ